MSIPWSNDEEVGVTAVALAAAVGEALASGGRSGGGEACRAGIVVFVVVKDVYNTRVGREIAVRAELFWRASVVEWERRKLKTGKATRVLFEFVNNRLNLIDLILWQGV